MARKLLTMVAAAALAVGSTAAQAAAPLSVANSPAARASANMDDTSDLRGSTAPVFIGLILAVLLIAIVVGDNRNEVSNSP